MRHVFLCAIMCLAGVVMAETPTSPDLHLRGDRFKPLTYDEMTAEQKALVNRIQSGPRGGTLDGPFNVYLRSPEIGDAAQQLGAQVRYHSSIPRKLNEFAILITGRYWNAQYEWYAHKKYALEAGLNPAIIDALAAGKRPPMQKDEEVIYNFCTEMLHTKQVSDAAFNAAKEQVGERGIVDLIGLMGYYTLVSMTLNADRYPLPNGEKPPLAQLK